MKNKKKINFSNVAHTLITVVSLILIFIVILSFSTNQSR